MELCVSGTQYIKNVSIIHILMVYIHICKSCEQLPYKSVAVSLTPDSL